MRDHTKHSVCHTPSISARLADHIDRHFERHRSAPITTEVEPETIRRHLEEHFDFARPIPLESVFSKTTDMLWMWAEHATNPMHFGLTRPTVDKASVIADALVALYDPNLAMWEFSPAAIEIERHVLKAIGRFVDVDVDSGFANFTSGGQEANHTAVAVALTARFHDLARTGLRALGGQPTLYSSAEGHHSFEKVAHVTGLGRDALRAVPVREDLTLSIEALSTMLTRDLARGFLPFLVVGTAGTTGAGVVDPLTELARVATDFDLWLHVDAAWGGAASLSPSLKPTLAGIELADSITLDAHKWLSVPVGAGMFFCRHRRPVLATFAADASYVPALAGDDRVYPMYSTMQWSRRFIGLKLFMMLAQHGGEGIARRIEQQAKMGDLLRTRLREHGWRILNRTPLPVVCFTHERLESSAVSHDDVVDTLKKRQIAWISRVVLRGNLVALRASITNYNTRTDDVERLVQALNLAIVSPDALQTPGSLPNELSASGDQHAETGSS